MAEDETTPLPPLTLNDARISEVLRLGLRATEPLRAQELKAIWEHELASPLAFDLASLPAPAAAEFRLLCHAQGLVLRSLGDLLAHPLPPLRALELVKNFAKVNRESPHSGLPRPVATVLYYACIAAALLRHNSRITQLSAADLAQGFDWVLAQPWINGRTRAMIRLARQKCDES